MSQQNDTGFLSIVAGAARAAYLRVYNSSGTWTTAGASNQSAGVQIQPSLAATDQVSLKSCTGPGTLKMTASGIIAVGGDVYAAASGKVAATGTIIEGVALEAAAADGDIIEVLPVHNRDVSSAITGTTSSTFEVDSDAATPKIALTAQTAGTGDFTTTLKPEAALAANTYVIVPETADGDTLMARGIAETVTGAKTFTGRTVHTGNVANTAGVGITGTATSWVTSVEKSGSMIKTTLLVDLTGLNSGASADEVIGADGAGVAHLGQITAAVNGTIISGRMTCLETPATGDDDIDVYSASEATGVEDTDIGLLTETQLCNSGDLTAGTVVALTPPAADQYLYLVGGTGGDATYSAGILLLEFWGKAA